MKFRFLVACLQALLFALFSVVAFAQGSSVLEQKIAALTSDGVVFRSYDTLFEALPPLKNPRNELEREAVYLRLHAPTLQSILTERPEAIRLSIPYGPSVLHLQLYQENILTPDFSVKTGDWEDTPIQFGVFYRGIIEGEGRTLVALSCFENEVMGLISGPAMGNLNLGRMEWEGNESTYVLYNDALLPEQPFGGCEVLTPDPTDKPHEGGTPDVAGCTRIFMEADFALYQNKGSSVQNTVNYVTGFFNVVATLYANETVAIAMSQLYVWTAQDPYNYSGSNATLNSFVAFRTNFDGDLAHLVSLAGSGLGGIAYLNVLCSNTANYAFSGINSSYQNLPTYSWTVNVVAHELGHNFSSNHTHWCGWSGGAIDNCGPTAGYGYETPPSCSNAPTPVNGGTIMSYCHLVGGVGVNLSNGFGPQPGNALRNATTSALGNGCIVSTCPVSSCSAPTSITFSNITNTSVSIAWNTVGGATTYHLQYRVAGTAAWTTVLNVATPYSLSGLSGNTRYEVQIQAVCGGSASPYATGAVFRTNTSACAEPSGLSASVLSTASVSLNWTENGSATNWDIQYGLQGFGLGSGTVINTSTRPYTLTGLTQGTAYSYYLRANCTGGTVSTWVGPVSFSTPFGNDLSSDAVLLTVGQPCTGNPYSNSGATVSSGEFSPLLNSNYGYWNTSISHTVWFRFVAPASGTVLVNTDKSPQGTLNDTQIALYSTVNPTTADHLLVSNEDGGSIGAGYNTFVYSTGLTPGTTYYIQVDGWSTQTGTFCIEVMEAGQLPTPATCTAYNQANVNGATNPNRWYNIYTRPNNFNIGVPVAAVKSSVNLGTVTVSQIRNAAVPVSPGGVPYMQRYVNFSSTQNAAAPKDIRLMFTSAELDALKNAASLPNATAEDLNISHYDGVNEDCTPNNNAGNGFSVISNVSATAIGSSGQFYLQFTSPSFSEMGAMFGTAALPVELLYFAGEEQSGYNELRWELASEEDILEMVLERSVTGLTEWAPIAAQAARGEGRYGYQDVQPPVKSWYRLAIRTRDGSVAYSPMVEINRTPAGGIWSLSPNPARSEVLVQYHALAEGPVVFRLHGVEGRIALESVAELDKGVHAVPLSLDGLSPGVYFCSANGVFGKVLVVE